MGSIPGSEDAPEEGLAAAPVLLPGEPHGQRSLAGYRPRGCKGSDTTERLTARARTPVREKALQSLPAPPSASQTRRSDPAPTRAERRPRRPGLAASSATR